MTESTSSKIVHKLDKILHPGVNKEGKQVFGEGVGDTTVPRRPSVVEGDDRQGIGMGYGAAEGIDTRNNQYEHDLKTELGQRGPGAETRAGIGQGYEVPGGIGQGDNTMSPAYQRKLSVAMESGSGLDSVGELRKKSVGNAASSTQPGTNTAAATTIGAGNTTTTTTTTTGGHSNNFNNYSMTPGSTNPDAITPAPAAGTTHATHGEKDRLNSTASGYSIQGDQTAKLTPGRRESAIDSALAAGHADHSRAGQSGPHAGWMANVLDPNTGRDATT